MNTTSVPMTQEEAETAAAVIKDETKKLVRNLAHLRTLAVAFDERKGWSALGYNTIESCAKNEFGWSSRQFLRQLTAGKYEQDAGIPIGTTPEYRIRREITKPQQDRTTGPVSLSASSDGRNNSGRSMENAPETQAVPTDWQVVSAQAPQQSEPEPKKITPSGITGADMARVEFAPMPDAKRLDMLNQVDSLFDLGEIEAAVLKRHKISVGQAAGYFSQIVAAAEQGGPSWEMRMRIAARPNPK